MLLIIYLNFLFLFSEAYKLDYKRPSSRSNLLNSIIEIFKLEERDLKYLESKFDIKVIELIYPKTLERLKQMRRGVFGTSLKNAKSKMVAIKFEFDSSVRAKFDKVTQTVNCNQKNINGEPTEKYIATLMQNRSHFIKFYSSLSRQFKNGQIKVNIYVYERLPKSENLLQWTEKIRNKGTRNNQLEKNFRKYFKSMHLALSELHKEGFVYTDFKPENILMDSLSDKAYLIDLESVVSSKSKYVCLRTVAYTPPLFTLENKFIDSDSMSGRALSDFFSGLYVKSPHDRILSWTFCFSIYSLMCTRGTEVFSQNFQSKYKYWSSENLPFMTYFGCPIGEPTKMFTDLINGCLVKIPKKPIFDRLIKHPWLANEIKD